MPRSVVVHTSNDFNEISVSSQSAEHFQASGSVEQPSSEVSVEQFRLSASSQRAEQDRSSFDDITEIQRPPPRSGGESPTSIDTGEGQHLRDRSQSSETSSRGRSRRRKRSKRGSDRHRSRDRRSRHRSSERRNSRTNGSCRLRHHDSRNESGHRCHPPDRNHREEDRNERSGGNSNDFRNERRNKNSEHFDDRSRRDGENSPDYSYRASSSRRSQDRHQHSYIDIDDTAERRDRGVIHSRDVMDNPLHANIHIDGHPLFVDYDSTPIQGVTSNLPSLRQEVSSNINTSVPALELNIPIVRVEEPTLDLGNTTTVNNNCLVFSSQPHNTIRYECADSQIKITQKSTRLHVLQVIANLNLVHHSYHHGEVIHPDFVPKFVDNLQLHHKGDSAVLASCVDWKEWKREFFISQLHALYPQNPDAIDMTFLQAIKDWRLLYDCLDETVVNKSFVALSDIQNRYRVKEKGDEIRAVKLLHDKLQIPDKTNWTIRFLKAQSECSVTLPLQTIVDFRFVLMVTFRNLYRDVKELQLSLHLRITGTANSKVIDGKKMQKSETHNNHASDNKNITCTMCGRFYHEEEKCPEVESKYANNTNSPYIGSAAHSLLVRETGPKGFIPNSKSAKRKIPEILTDSNEAPHKRPFEKRKEWKDKKRELLYAMSSSSSSTIPNLLFVSLSSSPGKTSAAAQVEALLDTGSLAGDFTSEEIVTNYNNFQAIPAYDKYTVRSGLENTCYTRYFWESSRKGLLWKAGGFKAIQPNKTLIALQGTYCLAGEKINSYEDIKNGTILRSLFDSFR